MIKNKLLCAFIVLILSSCSQDSGTHSSGERKITYTFTLKECVQGTFDLKCNKEAKLGPNPVIEQKYNLGSMVENQYEVPGVKFSGFVNEKIPFTIAAKIRFGSFPKITVVHRFIYTLVEYLFGEKALLRTYQTFTAPGMEVDLRSYSDERAQLGSTIDDQSLELEQGKWSGEMVQSYYVKECDECTRYLPGVRVQIEDWK